ncbi:hypothetical protein ABZ456_27550, partial [Streptomyces sp. NPDC005776]|uniref:hypothetical protein n=1 Tax=Streptomyces sp. NPDC005776 TaxID=3154676 RepID=UPI003408A0C1
MRRPRTLFEGCAAASLALDANAAIPTTQPVLLRPTAEAAAHSSVGPDGRRRRDQAPLTASRPAAPVP